MSDPITPRTPVLTPEGIGITIDGPAQEGRTLVYAIKMTAGSTYAFGTLIEVPDDEVVPLSRIVESFQPTTASVEYEVADKGVNWVGDVIPSNARPGDTLNGEPILFNDEGKPIAVPYRAVLAARKGERSKPSKPFPTPSNLAVDTPEGSHLLHKRIPCDRCKGSGVDGVMSLADNTDIYETECYECEGTGHFIEVTPEPDGVPLTYTDRGFAQAPVFICDYGSTVRVYESSSAEKKAVWLNVVVDREVLPNQSYGEGTAHLTVEQAEQLIANLRAILDNHHLDNPHAWGDTQ